MHQRHRKDGAPNVTGGRRINPSVWSAAKRIEKLRYLHRNPVARGLVEKPQDWPWSSSRHYATGVEGVVEIESEWTAHKREAMGIRLKVRAGAVSQFPPKQSLDGAPPSERSC